MADSKREAALKALLSVLAGISGPTVKRNMLEEQDLPDGGLIVLLDGDPGDPDVTLSPPSYYFQHRAEVVVHVGGGDAAARDAALDALLQQIAAAVSADDTLGGAVEMATLEPAEFLGEPVEGGAAVKSAEFGVVLEYEATTPLG